MELNRLNRVGGVPLNNPDLATRARALSSGDSDAAADKNELIK
jgi:hypothetical protein